MKNGGPNHPKTIHLADLLGLERWGAVGVVETLIHWCRQYAIQGNIGKWSNKAIADGIGWKGDPDKLIQSLVLATFLDEHEDAEIRLIVHDIEKHADNTWKQNLENAGLKWWNGKKPRSGKSGRPKGVTTKKLISRKPPEKLQNLEIKSPQPEPKPEPEPKPIKTDMSPSAAVVPESEDTPHKAFVSAWNALGKPFAKIEDWHPKRQQMLRTRWGEAYFREHWQEALQVMQRLNWCRGETDRGWVANVEYFLKPGKVANLMEQKGQSAGRVIGRKMSAEQRNDLYEGIPT